MDADAAAPVEPPAARRAPKRLVRRGAAWSLPVLAAVAVVAGLWAGRDFLIPLVMAIVLSVLLWPFVKALDRVLRLRALSALAAVLATLFFAGSLALSVGSKLSSSTEELPNALRLAARDIASLGTASARAMMRTRSALTELDRTVARATGTPAERPVAPAEGVSPGPRSIVTQLVEGVGRVALAASRSVAGALLQTGMIAMLTFFMLCSGEALGKRMTGWCGAGVPGPDRCGEMLGEAARQIRLFAGVTVVTNIAIGIGIGVGFWLFDVPDAWMWGMAAGALHFLPYAGLAAMMALAALQVYVVQASLSAALLAAVFVMCIGIVVGTAMAVWLQGRVAKIDSATLFFGTIFWSVLWGGWGLLLGPLLVVVAQLFWKELPRLRNVPKVPNAPAVSP